MAASRLATPSASFASLPDALLKKIIIRLDLADRHRAALVNRRWHAAVHSPDWLQGAGVVNPSLAQLQSLTAWLLRHGRRTHSFHIGCYEASSEEQSYTLGLEACLEALAGAKPLQLLRLSCGCKVSGLCIRAWCAELRQLKSLDLSTNCSSPGSVRISSSLAGLSAVTQLQLEGEPVVVDAAAQLPPNVERLSLKDSQSAELPQQLSRLTCLSMLVLSTESCPPDGYALLTRLGRLARLSLHDSNHLPACLPQLTTLCELYLNDPGLDMEPAEIQAALEAALQQLTQLTSLCIIDAPARIKPPAALAGLSRLQRCCLDCEVSAENSPPPLPPGPWAAGLRSLGASMDVLQHSTAMLSAATQLSRLVAIPSDFPDDEEEFWVWARCHPSLQRLQIDAGADVVVSAVTVHAICRLTRQRPQLEVTTVLAKSAQSPTFAKEFQFQFESVQFAYYDDSDSDP